MVDSMVVPAQDRERCDGLSPHRHPYSSMAMSYHTAFAAQEHHVLSTVYQRISSQPPSSSLHMQMQVQKRAILPRRPADLHNEALSSSTPDDHRSARHNADGHEIIIGIEK